MNASELGAIKWRRSTRSGANGNCLEVAELDRAVAVRDSKDQDGPALAFNSAAWGAFTTAIKQGSLTA